jgi:hypothetical protein
MTRNVTPVWDIEPDPLRVLAQPAEETICFGIPEITHGWHISWIMEMLECEPRCPLFKQKTPCGSLLRQIFWTIPSLTILNPLALCDRGWVMEFWFTSTIKMNKKKKQNENFLCYEITLIQLTNSAEFLNHVVQIFQFWIFQSLIQKLVSSHIQLTTSFLEYLPFIFCFNNFHLSYTASRLMMLDSNFKM